MLLVLNQGTRTSSRPGDVNNRNRGPEFLMLRNAAEWAPAFATTAQALSHPYVLRFLPAVADGKRHSLKVRMKAPGHTAVAASSYVAPTTARH